MTVMSLRRTMAHLRHWAELVGPDDELLRLFAKTRDEAAFAELVRRHGGMVLGVARRVLGDHHAAEDVLQATFLLLARKARRVRWQRHIAPWLHAAAYRLACEARRQQSRQPASFGAHSPGCTDESSPPDRPLLWQEVRAAVDEELTRMPARLQAPLVLCCLQGLTRDEAARQLGWTLATLRRRLEHGRRLLRDRLSRRGLTLAATLALLNPGEETLSAEAVRCVVQATARIPISAPLAALLAGRGRKIAALALLLIAGLCGGWLAGLKRDVRGQQPKPPAAPATAERTDRLGDPLPEGAIARLGTVRLRPGVMVQSVAFSPDGNRLATWGRAWLMHGRDQLIISDVASGRDLNVVPLPPCILLRMHWLPDGRGLALVKLDLLTVA